MFHAKVPKAIKKEYETIEYLMSHAWYHYPLYDEAMNKLLRAFELAVKLKCGQLSIPIDFINKKGEKRSKILAELIKEISLLEPGKRLSIFLDHLRDLRNTLMHPSEHSYMGGMMREKIILTINILNILFGEENYFVDLRQRNEEITKELWIFNQKATVFQRGNEYLLLHHLSFCDVVVINGEEIVLLFLNAVGKLSEELMEKKAFPIPIILEAKNLALTNEVLMGIDANSGENILMAIDTEPGDLKAAEGFRNYLFGLKEEHYNPYLTRNLNEQGKEMQRFRYRHYHSLFG